MRDMWAFAFKTVIGEEGGFQNDRRDKGNRTHDGRWLGTKFGISGRAYPDEDIKNLTLERAKEIYKRDYWDAMHLDQVPAGLDLALFDFAVNSGVSRATKIIQGLVGVHVDGIMGPITLAAIQAASPDYLIEQLSTRRLNFLENLPSWGAFGKGWTKRVHRIRKIALQMDKNEGDLPEEDRVHSYPIDENTPPEFGGGMQYNGIPIVEAPDTEIVDGMIISNVPPPPAITADPTPRLPRVEEAWPVMKKTFITVCLENGRITEVAQQDAEGSRIY